MTEQGANRLRVENMLGVGQARKRGGGGRGGGGGGGGTPFLLLLLGSAIIKI